MPKRLIGPRSEMKERSSAASPPIQHQDLGADRNDEPGEHGQPSQRGGGHQQRRPTTEPEGLRHCAADGSGSRR